MAKPNIIYLMADDLGLGDVTVYDKSSTIPTPNMEKLARQGTTFTDAHSPAAVCSPTRYAVLSGRYPFRSRDYQCVLRSAYDEPLLVDGQESIAQLLKRGGYRTAAFGKWHVGMNFVNRAGDGIARAGVNTSRFSTEDVDFSKPLTDGPTTHGFDHFFGIGGSINHGPYSFIEDDHITVLPEYIRDEFRPSSMGCYRQDWVAPGWNDAHQGKRCAEQAVEFIRDHVGRHPGEPFFIYHAEVAPHWPHVPPKDILGQPIEGRGGWDDDVPERCDMIVQVDAVLGAFMDCLDELGLADNTILILTSDNGADTGLYEPIRGKKGQLYEGGHRIPFIARWPGHIPADASSEAIFSLHDMAATFAAVVGIEPAAGGTIDSVNQLPALLGEDTNDGMGLREEPLVLAGGGGGEEAIKKMVLRQGPWKLLLHDGEAVELYNLKEDLKETTNRLETDPEIAKDLLAHWPAIRDRS